ncbi:MAG: RlmE family RNA methyltransferase [Desulfobacteraceae bacterium]|nr:RlmE family RNA methyltransferase [Desulfobacteraceae bacterium]
MRKIQDHYFKKAKQERYPARSVYKLQEAQDKYRFLTKGDKVLDLGCHPGSWSLYAARTLGPAGLVVGADLQRSGGRQVEGGAPIRWLTADITAPDFIAAVRDIAPRFQVVLSDAAPRTTGSRVTDEQRSLELARQVLAIAAELLAPGGALYCKIFEGEDFKEYVEEVRTRFGAVRIVKPKSSRPESREVFVLGTGFFPGRQEQ